MSENLDLVRSIYANWERGIWSSADWADPDIELVAPDGPNPGSWMGAEAMAKAWREHLSAFTDFRAEADEYRELEGARVLVLHHWTGRGRTSALSVEQMGARSATVFHIHEGKIVRLLAYWDRDRALADLGLEE